MSLIRPLAVMAVLLAGASLGGCSTLDKVNPFDKKKNKVIASQGVRVPLVAFNTKVEVAEALKGQAIVLPAMQLIDSWPQPGGPTQGWVDNVAAAQNFQVVWRRDIGQGANKEFHITATPVVADNKVFVMDGEASVSALDANSGAVIWRTDTAVHTRRDKQAFGGGVTYANGKVYVSSGYRFIAALDGASGRLLWRTPTDAPIHDAPSVGGGHAIAIDVNDQMVSVDAETGAPDWTYQALTEPARLIKASSPVISGDAIIGAFASGELISLRASNGNPLWSQVLSRSNRTNALSEIRDIAGRPVVRQGEVFAGSHSGVFMAVDLQTGQPKWAIPVTTLSTPWPAGDVVYVVSKAGEVIAAARASGQVYWIRDLNLGIKKRKNRSLYYGPILASNRLIVTSDNGAALALDPKTGATLSQINLGGPALVAPVAANGLVYVVTADGDLVAIR
jgi:outer membrane protein assembly factor BamB